MSFVLSNLPRIPYLISLDISHHFQVKSFSGHRRFPEVHQSQLQHLAIEFEVTTESEKPFDQDWCRVPLPGLQSLSLCVTSPRPPWEAMAIIPYIQRHVLTVSPLKVDSLTFSYDKVASILTGPTGGNYQPTKLGTLELEIRGLARPF
ncbi:hypothetical protein M413DRAFT_27892 [Hebeloma cylindrosporum]|uniref:Uncharacterized protein n=1 Tax=Hebeloma cylindrosporum TaxID=76867 RepID=A0A0C2YKL3_HEBCY|nr:hypothetical protein M413DRAFT_27892 [Hebeloma cylindrosporum h7]